MKNSLLHNVEILQYIDEKLTRLYGVDTTKEIVIIDTLGFVSVKRLFIWS